MASIELTEREEKISGITRMERPSKNKYIMMGGADRLYLTSLEIYADSLESALADQIENNLNLNGKLAKLTEQLASKDKEIERLRETIIAIKGLTNEWELYQSKLRKKI